MKGEDRLFRLPAFILYTSLAGKLLKRARKAEEVKFLGISSFSSKTKEVMDSGRTQQDDIDRKAHQRP